MAEHTYLARSYAKAAFDYALQQQAFAAWQSFLNAAAVVMQNDKVMMLARHPAVQSAQLFQLLQEVIPGTMSDPQNNFLHLLAHYRRLLLLPEAAQWFKQMVEEYQKIIEVNVYTVVPLTPPQQDKLAAKLQQRLNKQVRLNCQLKPELLGGLLIQAGDMIIDNSFLGKLQRLSKELC